MGHPPSVYKPPESREELLQRYGSGERSFPDTELSDTDLSGVKLDGASFEKWSWFSSTNFEGAIGEEDVGYGPARAFHSSEVRQLAAAIAGIDDAIFRKRFSVAGMTKAEIYPWFGSSVEESDDDAIPYFLGYFQQLRAFVQKAADASKGLLVYVD